MVEGICVRGWLCLGFMGLITVVYARARAQRDFVWVNRDHPRLLSFSPYLLLSSTTTTTATTAATSSASVRYRVIAFSARKCPLSTLRLVLYARAYVSSPPSTRRARCNFTFTASDAPPIAARLQHGLQTRASLRCYAETGAMGVFLHLIFLKKNFLHVSSISDLRKVRSYRVFSDCNREIR